MSINNAVIAEMGVELEKQASTFDGTWQLIGVLAHNPVHIIFDNQSTDTAAQIGNNATDVWKTFEAGEALVLDMRGNHGIADNFTFRKGMSIWVRGDQSPTAGEYMRISYTYANPTPG